MLCSQNVSVPELCELMFCTDSQKERDEKYAMFIKSQRTLRSMRESLDM